MKISSLLFFLAGLAVLTSVTHAQTSDKDLITKGQYIFALAGGCACHTEPKGIQHAGGRAFPVPFGTVYSTNITQDKETGLGDWTDQQISDAIVKGTRPDGSRVLPVMPYEAYSGMAQDDLKALIAYLRTLKPVKKATPQMKSWVPFNRSLGVPLWLKLFGNFSSPLAQAPQEGIERGRYLVEHVSLCIDCHTPRNFIGVPNRSMYLAGAGKKIGPLGQAVPNITPDKDTGISEWKREDITGVLLTGTKPDLDNIQGLMAEVIEQGYKHMTKQDALAIADYVKSVRPIKNRIE
ncbi:MAG TPA: cytochrome c [Candidatus Udaeobacter sp.]|jgi:mono/diheme cytochrome c family protein|nr:cytochrome c [Candidatus Udaeobacter sp.]